MRNTMIITISESEGVWEEAVITYFKVYS